MKNETESNTSANDDRKAAAPKTSHQSLSLSSSSSSSSTSESETKPPSTVSGVTTISSLPPRSPFTSARSPEHQVQQQVKTVPTAAPLTSEKDTIEKPFIAATTNTNVPNDPIATQSNNEPKKPPQHKRNLSFSAAKLAGIGVNNQDSKQQEDGNDKDKPNTSNAERQEQTFPPRIATAHPRSADHRRKVSWGGKQIEVPHIDTDNLIGMQMPLSEKMTDHLLINNNVGVVDSSLYDNESALRAKVASELVSSIEAAMPSDNLVTTPRATNANTKQPLHHHTRNQSLTQAIKVNDLAKMHPIESEATYEIMKAIETHEGGGYQLQEEEQSIEAVASLFQGSESRLLENVPEGAEGIFSHSRKMSTASSVANASSLAGGSAMTPMSETMIGSSTYKRDLSPARSNRSRLFSNDNTHASGLSRPGHQRANTIVTDQTITSASRTPSRQQQQLSRNRHRRQETMEERLFHLNQALDAANNAPKSPERTASNREHHPERNQRNELKLHHHEPSASLDLFNQNLARLFQGLDDINSVSGREEFDEEEAIPLTESMDTPSTSNPTMIQNKSTGVSSNAGNEELRDEDAPTTADAFLNGHHRKFSSMLQRETIADAMTDNEENSKKKFEFETIDSDIEAPIPRPTRSPKSDKKSSTNSHDNKKKQSQLYRLFCGIGFVNDIKLFLRPRVPAILRYVKSLSWLILIATITSMVLFYGLGNPPLDQENVVFPENRTCSYHSGPKTSTGGSSDDLRASYSWWILYLLVRLPITFTIAWFLEILLVDFLILECRWVGSCIGSTFTLLVVQAKGWPAIVFFWPICNLVMLYGNSPFVNHWGHWQDFIELFNECNPSGNIIASNVNLRIQLLALAVSIVVAVKRLLIGFHQGRKTFLHYAGELSTLMTKILLISEVSNLAIDLELEADDDDDDLSDPDDDSYTKDKNFLLKSLNKTKRPGMGRKQASIADMAGIETAARGILDSGIDSDSGVRNESRGIDDEEDYYVGTPLDSSLKSSNSTKTRTSKKNSLLIADQDREFVTGLLSQSQRRRIEQLLGNWEEPEKDKILTESVSIGAILQFRKSLSRLDSQFPFSYAFGKADVRDHCIESSQNLYLRLLEKSRDKIFHFNILGLVALEHDGSLDQEKLKSLIKVFRPDRDGRLSLIDFVKSVDVVYKEMKLLRASVRSSQKIDKSFESIFNILFYFVIACIILNVLGQDPIAVFVSLSSVVLSFSFMISQASSKYVEGLLFILYRRPYDIGDYIVIQPVEEGTSWMTGSADWIVRDINLFTTTVIHSFTNEVATLSNGSIANSRVMNGNRSLPAILYVKLRFGVDTSFEKLDIFREALSQYVDNRPREWVKLLDIKNINVQSDQGYVEYLISLQHVNNWQEYDSLRWSRSHVSSFCHELSKQLDIRYKSPPLPVDLNIHGASNQTAAGNLEEEMVRSAVAPSLSRMSAESEQIRNLIDDIRM